MNSKISKIIEKCLKENPCEVDIRYDEPMSDHTTFRVGGKADCWVCPDGEGFTTFCIDLLSTASAEQVPVFILGGGANTVVSDKGIRGIVLDMNMWNGESVWALLAGEDEFVIRSGSSIDEAADAAAAAHFSGLEFLAGMPGTIGGAIWMNARCYEREISDILSWVEIICKEPSGEYVIKRFNIDRESASKSEGDVFHISEFGYKKSPFQDMECIIISAAFKLKKGDKEKILEDMENKRQDREDKGHYQFPCAGSAFKNNQKFGKSTGQIIDELGLKELNFGGAKVAPFHGNIIINTGKATASDIRSLMDEVTKRVEASTGFLLEPEILFIGEW